MNWNRRKTDEVERARDNSLAYYREAFNLINKANAEFKKATGGVYSENPLSLNLEVLNAGNERDFTNQLAVFMDSMVWQSVMGRADIPTRLDDARARRMTERATSDNIMAALVETDQDKPKLFGWIVTEAFAAIHKKSPLEPFMLKHKVIVDNAMVDARYFDDETGVDDMLVDIERIFYILDGKRPCERKNSLAAQITDRAYECSTFEGKYFRVTLYSKSLHVFFTRSDLSERVNHIMTRARYDLITQKERS
jgi:hypothetical protein